MNLLKASILALFICAAFSSCSKKEAALSDPLLTNRDTTINPVNDFFSYANNGWFKKNPIKNSESSNGIWKTIQDTIDSQIKRICENAAQDKSAAKGSNKQKIGDFYTAAMDTVAIEKAGLSPLQAEINHIQAITDVSSLTKSIAHFQTIGTAPGFLFYIGQDDKASTKYAVFFYQGGLGLGDREYYFDTENRNVIIRKEYVKHIEKMMKLMGEKDAAAAKNASIIMKLETDLAKSSRKMEDLRDPVKNYNKMTVGQFNKLTPNIDWNAVLPILGIPKADTLIVGQPEFFTGLNLLLKKYSIEDWKTYLKWNLVNSYANTLNKDFEKQNFNFFGTIMNGTKEQKPRWERIVHATDESLGELIGQVYVTEYLPKGTKEKLLEIGNNVRDVYASHIKKLDWMSEVTKQKALQKLSKIVMKVGYPDKWKDMSSLSIDRKSYCSNVIRVSKWQHNYMVSKFGKKVDRTEWQIQPQTYNAYYNCSNNEIVVPACNIIVPGFEGRMPDDAVLYGIIGGSTFGHEITHGFDDQGSKYDENGNLNNWWTSQDLKKFKEKTKAIVSQYNNYAVAGKHVNGEATQGENIADLGGVIVGFEAFKKTEQYKKQKKISGLTPEQRYFLSYAYSWMINRRVEAKIRLMMTDVHSPEQFRINGPLSNFPAFYKAFNVKEGDNMYRPDSLRVVIW
ncbi:M13 family metallopeptidase [Flavobacterium sp. CF136]|uniref:M13 family metallopeptidase n=1 Tax=Flavobacterium sp. (strain CF136) TaxID=1144313 RepID=UPI000271C162|nr:M13 family metallopeptidase [Flavobacterium sp. CF136]EJL65157.1 putative metalloendopeptidase [Flavobacterium sp. CF136]